MMLVPCNAQAEAQVQATRSRDCPVFCEGRGRVKLTTAILTKARMGRDDSDEGISFRQEIEELGLIRNPKFQGLEARMLDLYPYSLFSSYKVSRIVSLGDVSISVRGRRTYPVVQEWIEGIKISSLQTSAGGNIKCINTCTCTSAAYELLHNI